ncbi:MAG: Uma2 family endonuclease [Planctomycetota bacterium]
MSTVPKRLFTTDEYLRHERSAEFKSEFYRGELFAMAGASREHNLIVGNLVRELGNSLKDRPCEVYPSDMRVKINATTLYTYADVSVACGPPEFEDDVFDTLLNPTLIAEVLSDSTESYDRGAKFAQYRRISSLKEVVLIAQDRLSIEVFCRSEDSSWRLTEFDAIDQTAWLSSVGVSIAVGEIYRNIQLDDESTQETSG